MTFVKSARYPPPLPLLDHPLQEPTAFRPEDLVQAVRDQRKLQASDMPEVCVLDFDGDLTDALVTRNEISRCDSWPCFHTSLWTLEIDRRRCGLVAHVTNAPDHDGESFDKGSLDVQIGLLRSACRGAYRYLDGTQNVC
jgi:hypothetical protein